MRVNEEENPNNKQARFYTGVAVLPSFRTAGLRCRRATPTPVELSSGNGLVQRCSAYFFVSLPAVGVAGKEGFFFNKKSLVTLMYRYARRAMYSF